MGLTLTTRTIALVRCAGLKLQPSILLGELSVNSDAIIIILQDCIKHGSHAHHTKYSLGEVRRADCSANHTAELDCKDIITINCQDCMKHGCYPDHTHYSPVRGALS